MARLKQSRAPTNDLTPQERKRVMEMVTRMCLKRNVPSWVVWNALYRFVAQEVWQIQQQKGQE